ncbi:MAG: alpha-2-macroglobulin family protein, partial [Pseudomonadota bacterium]|nr:alpha-2-macroglobulin family protein [Pseudomonadota bacterium]
MTGTIAGTTAPALASANVLVEDFLPERIDFDLSLPEATIRPGDSPLMTVEARYLFGAPAAGLTPQGTVILRDAGEVQGYPGYRFGRQDVRFAPRTEFFGGADTDADGRSTVPVALPEASNADRPLQAEVIVTLAEGSGRPVERRLSRDLAPAGPIIGIKQMFEDVVPEGTAADLQVIALGPQMEPVNMPVRWTLNRVTTRYQWYQQWGSWEWEPITTRKPVTSGVATLGSQPLTVTAPVDWGNYELVVESTEGDPISASSSFYAGWYAPA